MCVVVALVCQAEAARQEAKDELAHAEAMHAAFLASRSLKTLDHGEAKAGDSRMSTYSVSSAGRDSAMSSPAPLRTQGMCYPCMYDCAGISVLYFIFS